MYVAMRDSVLSTFASLLLPINTLSGGTPGEIVAPRGYLSGQAENLAGELMPLLNAAIGDDRQQWAEIAAGLHAAEGIPRPTVAHLFSAKPEARRAVPEFASVP